MKKILSAIVIVMVLGADLSRAQLNIYKGKLTTSLNANGNSISNVVSITDTNGNPVIGGTGTDVTVLRGATVLLYPTLTNAFAGGIQPFDVIKLGIGTNYVLNGIGAPIKVPPNVTITGLGQSNSVVFYDTNAFMFTNGDSFSYFSAISTNVWPTANAAGQAFSTYSSSANSIGVTWDNVGINTFGNGIQAVGAAATGIPGWTYKNGYLFSGQRGIYTTLAGGGSVTVLNNFITVQAQTNQPYTLVALSLSGPMTNTISGNTITIDANNVTNPVEYLGIYTAFATTTITANRTIYLNTNNLAAGTALVVCGMLPESVASLSMDSSVPSSDVGWTIAASDAPLTQIGQDWTKLGANELSLLAGQGLAVQSNALFDIPSQEAISFDYTNASTQLWATRFSGCQPGAIFSFSGFPQGLTNNVIVTNANGMSVMFYDTNAAGASSMILTNLSGVMCLVAVNTGDKLWITNVGSVPITAYRGGFAMAQSYVIDRVPNNLNDNSAAGVYNRVFGAGVSIPIGYWLSTATNITSIWMAKIGGPVEQMVISNFWCADAIPGTRGKIFTITPAGTTFGGVDIPTNIFGTHGYSGYMTNGIFISTGTY